MSAYSSFGFRELLFNINIKCFNVTAYFEAKE